MSFSSVTDEEAYSHGARALIGDSIRAEACIVTEPSFEQAIIGAPGKVLVRVTAVGKAAHGFTPEQGVNAAIACYFLSSRTALPSVRRRPRHFIPAGIWPGEIRNTCWGSRLGLPAACPHRSTLKAGLAPETGLCCIQGSARCLPAWAVALVAAGYIDV